MAIGENSYWLSKLNCETLEFSAVDMKEFAERFQCKSVLYCFVIMFIILTVVIIIIIDC